MEITFIKSGDNDGNILNCVVLRKIVFNKASYKNDRKGIILKDSVVEGERYSCTFSDGIDVNSRKLILKGK